MLVLEPGGLTQVGVMQYPQTLPLADKEVVLTFDDGPLPPYSNQVLDILAEQCVKATYFLVGEMAQSFPNVVRRMYQEGHTIGTHTEDHPLRMSKLPVEKVRWEIDQGIADVAAALGDPDKVAPFIRIPGLSRSPMIEDEAAARSLVIFSSDTVADDWHRHIKPRDIVSRAMSRLEKRGKGILLLHDIHKSTVAALPEILKELKERASASSTSCLARPRGESKRSASRDWPITPCCRCPTSRPLQPRICQSAGLFLPTAQPARGISPGQPRSNGRSRPVTHRRRAMSNYLRRISRISVHGLQPVPRRRSKPI